MNDEQADAIATELEELARQNHWVISSHLTFVSEQGYIREPDTVSFPLTQEGILEALAWLRQQAKFTRLKH